MELAETKGFVCVKMAEEKLKLPKIVFDDVIKSLINEGIVWVDDQPAIDKGKLEYSGERLYWFTSNLKSNVELSVMN